MTAADVHLGTGAMALDALPPEEAAEFRLHLDDCEFCTAELIGFLETAALLGSANAEQPPAALRERVLTAARNTPQLPPRVLPEEPLLAPAPPAVPLGPPHRHRAADESRRRWFARPAAWIAAAAVAAVLAGGITWWSVGSRTPQQTAAECLATASDVKVLTPQSGAGDVRWSASCAAASVTATGLAALPANQVYQLWVISGNSATKPRSVGVLPTSGGSTSAIATIGSGDTTVAMTVEPAGGSAEPTSTPFWVATL